MYGKLVFFLFYGFIHFWHSDILNEIDIFCGFEKAYHIVKKAYHMAKKYTKWSWYALTYHMTYQML